MFIATARDKKLDFGTETARAKFLEWLKQNEGKKVKLEPVKAKRSLSQNSYYWMYLGVIESETGELATDLHEYFKRKFLIAKEITIQGQTIKIPGSTTELTKADMGDYLDKICALTNVPLPDPIEAGYDPIWAHSKSYSRV